MSTPRTQRKTTAPKKTQPATVVGRARTAKGAQPPRERVVSVPRTPAQLDALLQTPMTLGATILPPEAQVMTVGELAQLLRISERVASTLVLRGEIASMKIGHLRRIPLYAVTEYIRLHTGAA